MSSRARLAGEPRLFVYVMTDDSGFAPNPFHKFCTLACCKPKIREHAHVGDYVAAISPKAHGHKLIYAMQVKEQLSIENYWKCKKFGKKKADPLLRDELLRLGDNIYEPTTTPATEPHHFRQHRSLHRTGEKENAENKRRDLSGKNVLIAPTGYFVYLGLKKAVDLPDCLDQRLRPLQQGHRCNFTDTEHSSFKTFFTNLLKKFGSQDITPAELSPPKCAPSCC